MSNAKQLGFYIDTSKCTGCKTCQIACKDSGNMPLGVKWRRVYEFGGGGFTPLADGTFKQDVFSYYVSIGCNHCDQPRCTQVCPTKAHTKRDSDGLVLIDAELCIGCRRCETACPYDAPQFNDESGLMTKCDGCSDRLAQGKQPICVESCPLRALEFGPMVELRAKYGDNADIKALPKSSMTKPNLIVKAHAKGNLAGGLLNRFEV